MLLYGILSVSIILTPFVYHSYSGYALFCANAEPLTSPPAWCYTFPPSIYTYVQSRYWNVGFLRYWTVAQIPNFIIAAPPLAALFSFSLCHLRNWLLPHLQSKLSQFPRTPLKQIPSSHIFFRSSLTPHAIHALCLSAMLLLASHTQIVLRLAASMPFIYWAAAWLLTEYPNWGRWWLAWSFVWSILSVVLWGASLPPA